MVTKQGGWAKGVGGGGCFGAVAEAGNSSGRQLRGGDSLLFTLPACGLEEPFFAVLERLLQPTHY